MSVQIRSAVDSQVVRPGATIRWPVEVTKASGVAVDNLPLNVRATGKVKPQQKKLTTDDEGKAVVESTASRVWERAVIEVGSGDSR